MGFSRDIHSVSRLVSEARAVLETGFPLLWVRGEISNFSQPSSGHLYFSLKDAGAQVRCVLWRSKRQRLTFALANGQQVVARAQVSLYEPRGEFQLLIEHLELDGAGALRLAFEQLKQRLAAEGLFDPALKRPLPAFPRQVGLITSPTGAAVRDLITLLERRLPALPVLIYPALVQGESAPESLIAALELANARADCDVLILARGGGSLEDLNAFNDERLARAIRASRIPVVSGVGHEIDFTIADLVADQRAPTPSAAAELVAPSGAHLSERVAMLFNRLVAAQQRRLDTARQRLDASRRHLNLLHPMARLQQQIQRLDRAEWRLRTLIANRLGEARRRLQPVVERLERQIPVHRIERARWRLEALERRLRRAQSELLTHRRERLLRAVAGLEARSPLGTLSRGYAILTRWPKDEIVRDPAQVAPGDWLRIRVAGGWIEAVAR
ncbi:exodeoxyribonuclease VII large subunit [Thermochromatium tepidum]|jgi:Exodeoxyribonuclease VII large subunit (EC 3.1.11.6)|uniref:Exodeoxyribonuclease 7 large subunit n=1 Tax=Thermochromatium tepidum ATCC 43061 TaxID=316276 RepID=A0A6I6DX56_THETI|nr:exodeoxyribonuclease VII large subunit [Thermochromatium tepidum]QGU32124.1 exodeoxyribonuclease VII large subunit [Thermochromatium tepidum ATCC 43061]